MLTENLTDLQINTLLETEISQMTQGQKTHADSLAELANFIEYAIQQSAVITLKPEQGVITIEKSTIDSQSLEEIAVKKMLEKTLADNEIELNRKITTEIKIKVEMEKDALVISLRPSLATSQAENITIETGNVALSVNLEKLKADLDQVLNVKIEKVTPKVAQLEQNDSISSDSYKIALRDDNDNKKALKNKLTLGLNAVDQDPDYNCVFIKRDAESEEALGGVWNKPTNKLEIKTNEEGTYYVKENRKSFTDLSNLDLNTKRAIEVLAAKGMISGTNATTFNPTGTINRAEFSKILIRALFLYDATAQNTFKDVDNKAWYSVYAASSKKAGLVNGYMDNTFKPLNVITKQEMVKICGATLYEIKGYTYPKNTKAYTAKYKDAIANWVEQYLALVEREGIITYNSAGLFRGDKGMTRADAAVMLYHLFKRL